MNFRMGFPETAGLVVLGGTIGALLGGADSGAFNMTAVLGALGGAAVPFAILVFPRLSRSNRA